LRCFRTGTKRIEREDEPRRVSLVVMIRRMCDRARLLNLVENSTLFSEHKAGLVKIIGQNHPFLGVNNAIASMLLAGRAENGAWFPVAQAQTRRKRTRWKSNCLLSVIGGMRIMLKTCFVKKAQPGRGRRGRVVRL